MQCHSDLQFFRGGGTLPNVILTLGVGAGALAADC